MSTGTQSSRANKNQGCPNHYDGLDGAASNCNICSPVPSAPKPNARTRRNAARAAKFRNEQRNAAKASIVSPVPLPVVPVDGGQQKTGDWRKLPRGQIWIRVKATPWEAKVGNHDDAIDVKEMLKKQNLDKDTKVFRLLFGFVAVTNGIFGIATSDDIDSVTGIPAMPVVGRVGFQTQTYRARWIPMGGKVIDEIDSMLVWGLNSNKNDAKRVITSDFWFAVSEPAPLMPPENLLDDGHS